MEQIFLLADIDECSHSVCGANSEKCDNSVGGYLCECKEGYQFSGSVYSIGCEGQFLIWSTKVQLNAFDLDVVYPSFFIVSCLFCSHYFKFQLFGLLVWFHDIKKLQLISLFYMTFINLITLQSDSQSTKQGTTEINGEVNTGH